MITKQVLVVAVWMLISCFLYDNKTGPCGDSVNVHVMFSVDISVLLFLLPLYLLSPLYPYERT